MKSPKKIEVSVPEQLKEEVKPVTKRKLLQRIPYFQLFLLITFLGFGILTFFAKTNPYFPFDLYITRTIQSIDYGWFNTLMVIVSKLGNVEYGTPSIILFTVFFILIKRKYEALLVLCSSVFLPFIGFFLKAFVSRPRPDPDLITQVGKFVRNDSFPSGHVLFAIALYGILLFLAYSELKRSTTRNILLVSLASFIILMGISRIYLGAHWFSDTLGSYLIGTVWLSLMAFIYHRLAKKVKLNN